MNVETGEPIMGLWAGNQLETLKFVAQKSGLNGGGVKDWDKFLCAVG